MQYTPSRAVLLSKKWKHCGVKSVNIWRALKLSSGSVDLVNYYMNISDHHTSTHHHADMCRERLDRCKERDARTRPQTPRLRCRCYTSTCNPANKKSTHNHMATTPQQAYFSGLCWFFDQCTRYDTWCVIWMCKQDARGIRPRVTPPTPRSTGQRRIDSHQMHDSCAADDPANGRTIRNPAKRYFYALVLNKVRYYSGSKNTIRHNRCMVA